MRRLLFLAALLLAAPLQAQPHPDFSGFWRLDRANSESVESKITDAAGPDDVKGTNAFGPQGHPGLGILPAPGLGKEVDRVMLRRLIVAAAETIDRIEIVQTAAEFKHVDSADNVRIFYLTREHVRFGRTEEKVKAKTVWRDGTLVIEQEGPDDLKMLETFSRPGGGDRLAYTVRLQHDRLKKPLELKMFYDRVPKP